MRDWRIAVAAAVGTAALIGTAQAITDNAFNYSTPKTAFFSINPAAMVPGDSGLQYMSDSDDLRLTAAGNGCFGTGVNLPQGAIVQTVVVWYSSGAGSPNVGFVRHHFDNAGMTEGYFLDASSNTGQRTQVGVAIPTTLATIANDLYSYSFVWCPATTDNHFHNARIKYTYNKAGS
jgi:hypothetical protein